MTRRRQDMLVFGQPAIGEEEINAVVETMRSKWVGTGPKVKQFQEEFADCVGGSFAVATSSCTAALHLCIEAAGIGAGDEVITTPMTFCATANAVIHAGAKPIFVDCDPHTGLIRTDLIASAITADTRAIIPIHFAGRPCDMDPIMTIASQNNLRVFEDCAHAIEATYHGKNCGTIGTAGCFSFYSTKNITTVEGGMVVTNDEALTKRLRTLSLHGLSNDAWKRFSDTGYHHYTVEECGYKYNMTDLQAAIGLCQLRKLARFRQRRIAIWRRYQDALADLPLLLPPPISEDPTHAYHLYTPLLHIEQTTLTRDRLIQRLANEKIGTGVHYVALHRHPLYQSLGYGDGDFPGAEFMSDRTFSLPLSPAMADSDVDDVIAAMHRILR